MAYVSKVKDTSNKLYDIKASKLKGKLTVNGIEFDGSSDASMSTYRAAWNASTAYHKGDVVSYEHLLWVALKDSTNQTPNDNSDYWRSDVSYASKADKANSATTAATATAVKAIVDCAWGTTKQYIPIINTNYNEAADLRYNTAVSPKYNLGTGAFETYSNTIISTSSEYGYGLCLRYNNQSHIVVGGAKQSDYTQNNYWKHWGISKNIIIPGKYWTRSTVNELDRYYLKHMIANRLFGFNSDFIDCEYSQDGGSTWSDSNVAANSKKSITRNVVNYCPVPIGVAVGTSTMPETMTATSKVKYLTRVTFRLPTGGKYCSISEMMMAVCGAHTLNVKVEYTTYGAQDTWQTWREGMEVAGWTNYNSFTLDSKTVWGTNSSSHVHTIRLTFGIQSQNESNNVTYVGDFRFFGENAWSENTKTEDIYLTDYSMTVFPRYDLLGENAQSIGWSSHQWANVFSRTFWENNTRLSDKYQSKTTIYTDKFTAQDDWTILEQHVDATVIGSVTKYTAIVKAMHAYSINTTNSPMMKIADDIKPSSASGFIGASWSSTANLAITTPGTQIIRVLTTGYFVTDAIASRRIVTFEFSWYK